MCIIRWYIVNTEEKVNEDKVIGDGIKTTQTSLITKGTSSELTTEILNESEQDKYIQYVDIIFKDENGDTIDTLIGYVGQTIKSGESSYVVSDVNIDMSKTKDIEYVVHY